MKFFFLFLFSALSAADFTFETEGGYQNSDFHWDIGSFDNQPDVISELQWKNLDGPYGLVRLRGDFPYSECFAFLEGSGSVTTEGRVSDSDYFKNDRKGLYLRTVSNAKGSPFWGLRGAIGQYFFFFDSCVRLDLSIGGRYEQECLKLNGGELLFSSIGPVSFKGLRSRYVATWIGFEGNALLEFRKGPFSLTPSCSLFIPHYSARGYWNLQPIFAGPFTHKSWGVGYDFRVRGAYQLFGFHLGLNFHLLGLRTSNGVDTTFVFDDFGEIMEAKGRLNLAAFNSRMYTVNVSFDF